MQHHVSLLDFNWIEYLALFGVFWRQNAHLLGKKKQKRGGFRGLKTHLIDVFRPLKSPKNAKNVHFPAQENYKLCERFGMLFF